MRIISRYRAHAIALVTAALLAPPAATAESTPPAYWLSVAEPGVYRVTYDDLVAVSPIGAVDSALLGLSSQGSPVPIWVDDGGDGSFGEGDSLEFLGRHLGGDVSFYNEHSHFNRYRLSFDGSSALRIRPGLEAHGAGTAAASLRARRHIESDAMMVRFAQQRDAPDQEIWFWRRLSFLDGEPFNAKLDLEGLADGEAFFKVDLRGWSRHRVGREDTFKQHRVEVKVNGHDAGVGEWDGQDVFTLESPPLDAALLDPEASTIEVVVPKRFLEESDDPLVDLSLLNWIEVDYPHDGTVTRPQTRFSVEGDAARSAPILAPDARSLVAFAADGVRWSTTGEEPADLRLTPTGDGADFEIFAVRDDGYRSPDEIAVDRVSSWRHPGHRSDYLMIAHESLLEGAERLADFHRSRGLEVAVIDVEDLYDEFNHGIVHPRAIRDFIAYTQTEWASPAPKFALLVGDASWDVDRQDMADENYADWSFQNREGTREGFLKNKSTPYEGAPRNRALIPTGSFKNAEGHAASDNYFVAVGGDEEYPYLPELAIGRLPVVEREELDAIIDKTIRYVEESGVGPWRRQLLWISNEDDYIQKRTDILADQQVARGFSADRVYPQKSEDSNAMHQEKLLDAFAEGQLLVHFHGHGGRYIWRTGATDYRKNRDLFNLDHLDQLQPSARLPVILSMTCFSAPFDHPLADSIGEKFLRLPDRGAIAVFAASWRNAPASKLSQALVEQLTIPQTIGEAILAAKRETLRRDMIETYNLLGDPAVPVAAPQTRLDLEVDSRGGEGLRLEALLPSTDGSFDGRAIVEWQSAAGAIIQSEELEVRGDRLEAAWLDAPPEVEAVSVYVWDEAQGLDAIGVLNWAVDPEDELAGEVPGQGAGEGAATSGATGEIAGEIAAESASP